MNCNLWESEYVLQPHLFLLPNQESPLNGRKQCPWPPESDKDTENSFEGGPFKPFWHSKPDIICGHFITWRNQPTDPRVHPLPRLCIWPGVQRLLVEYGDSHPHHLLLFLLLLKHHLGDWRGPCMQFFQNITLDVNWLVQMPSKAGGPFSPISRPPLFFTSPFRVVYYLGSVKGDFSR